MHSPLIQNPQVSFKAQGIFNYILLLPKRWKFNMEDLLESSSDNEEEVISGLKELINIFIQAETEDDKKILSSYAFEKAIQKEKPNLITEKWKKYVENWEKNIESSEKGEKIGLKDILFIHPATWLNQEGWKEKTLINLRYALITQFYTYEEPSIKDALANTVQNIIEEEIKVVPEHMKKLYKIFLTEVFPQNSAFWPNHILDYETLVSILERNFNKECLS